MRSRVGPNVSPTARRGIAVRARGDSASRKEHQQLELGRAVGLADRWNEAREQRFDHATARTKRSAQPFPLAPDAAHVDEAAADRVVQGERELARAQLAALHEKTHVADDARRPRDRDAVQVCHVEIGQEKSSRAFGGCRTACGDGGARSPRRSPHRPEDPTSGRPPGTTPRLPPSSRGTRREAVGAMYAVSRRAGRRLRARARSVPVPVGIRSGERFRPRATGRGAISPCCAPAISSSRRSKSTRRGGGEGGATAPAPAGGPSVATASSMPRACPAPETRTMRLTPTHRVDHRRTTAVRGARPGRSGSS